MRKLSVISFVFAVAALLCVATPSHAQISVGIGIGAAPACPYGYYGYAPYRCAPYGYYGPEWFNGGTFLGAGPWHHGDAFYGHVNRGYDPRYGYHGRYPTRGAQFDNRDFHDFHGTHYSDHTGRYHTEAQHDHYAGHH